MRDYVTKSLSGAEAFEAGRVDKYGADFPDIDVDFPDDSKEREFFNELAAKYTDEELECPDLTDKLRDEALEKAIDYHYDNETCCSNFTCPCGS